jgi:polyisoprenoid-binding protein YceI
LKNESVQFQVMGVKVMKRKNSRWLSVAFLYAFTSFATGAAATPPATKVYRISKDYTTLSFTATKWKVFKEEGIFRDFSGSMTYDPASPEVCAIEVIVQAASLDTRNATRDKVLRSDDFFDAEKYPTLSFRSINVKTTGTDSLDVTGDLTIHSITKRITVPVRIIGARVLPGIGEFAGFEATFDIDRRDYGILGTRWSGNTVAIDPVVLIHLIIGGVRH